MRVAAVLILEGVRQWIVCEVQLELCPTKFSISLDIYLERGSTETKGLRHDNIQLSHVFYDWSRHNIL